MFVLDNDSGCDIDVLSECSWGVPYTLLGETPMNEYGSLTGRVRRCSSLLSEHRVVNSWWSL
jgi:hypothetical protein